MVKMLRQATIELPPLPPLRQPYLQAQKPLEKKSTFPFKALLSRARTSYQKNETHRTCPGSRACPSAPRSGLNSGSKPSGHGMMPLHLPAPNVSNRGHVSFASWTLKTHHLPLDRTFRDGWRGRDGGRFRMKYHTDADRFHPLHSHQRPLKV